MGTKTMPGAGHTGRRLEERKGLRSSQAQPQSTTDDRPRQALYGDNGRVVAVIVAGVLTKTVNGPGHFLHNPPALAVNLNALTTADAQGVRDVAITDRATGTVYSTTIQELHRYGWVLQRDVDAQIAMRLSRWSVNGAPPADAPRPSPSPAPAAQLRLW